jgi:UDP-N-acetylmuramoyl-tripeptide--D-alanyl-D-alanine ligase
MRNASTSVAIFTREELTEFFNCNVPSGVDDISVNSTSVKKGDLFVAMKGERNDAHDFVREAFTRGCSLAIVEKIVDGVDANKLIMVKSSREALVNLAKFNMSRVPNASYMAITGSVGKTTTKDMLYHLLSNVKNEGNSNFNKVYASRKNFNSQIGVPLCAAVMPRDTQMAIFEMGMSLAGEIGNLVSVVPPNASLITNICEAHLEYFSSVFDIAAAKSEIFATKNPQETAIIPADSAYTDFLKDRARSNGVEKILSFGFDSSADARVLSYEKTRMQVKANASSECAGWSTLRNSNLPIFEIVHNGLLEQCLSGDQDNGLDITAEICGKVISYRLLCGNISSILNSISAILAAHVWGGIGLEKLAKIMSTFLPSTRRGEIFRLYPRERTGNGILIMDDSYNACPTSTKAAIKSIAMCHGLRKIVVIGDMLELGQRSVYFHENLSSTIDKYGIDKVFACGTLAQHLFNNLQEEKKGVWCEDVKAMAGVLLEEVQDGDCLLIKGSRSMHMDYIVDFLKDSL